MQKFCVVGLNKTAQKYCQQQILQKPMQAKNAIFHHKSKK
jgi:hypothetical protein